MGKNLLSDTDYTKGRDNRFGVTAVVARVAQIEVSEKGANVRVVMPDRLDHKDQPLISKPIPVMQIASKAKRSFAVPRLKTNVLCVKLPNGTGNYAVIGTFYTTNDPPPVTDPLLDYTEWEGGHKETHDANDGAAVFLKQEFEGGWDATIKKKNINIKTTESGGKISIIGEGDVLLRSANGNTNVESPNGKVTINQKDIDLLASGTIKIQAATIRLIGNVIVTGNMTQTGVHQDSLGFHTGGAGASGSWKYTTSPTPNVDGQMKVNASTWEAATTVSMNTTTDTAADVGAALDTIVAGDELFLQDKTNPTNYGHYMVTGAATDYGDWMEYPVSLIDFAGVPPANNILVTVTAIQWPASLRQRITALEARIAQLETLHQNDERFPQT